MGSTAAGQQARALLSCKGSCRQDSRAAAALAAVCSRPAVCSSRRCWCISSNAATAAVWSATLEHWRLFGWLMAGWLTTYWCAHAAGLLQEQLTWQQQVRQHCLLAWGSKCRTAAVATSAAKQTSSSLCEGGCSQLQLAAVLVCVRVCNSSASNSVVAMPPLHYLHATVCTPSCSAPSTQVQLCQRSI